MAYLRMVLCVAATMVSCDRSASFYLENCSDDHVEVVVITSAPCRLQPTVEQLARLHDPHALRGVTSYEVDSSGVYSVRLEPSGRLPLAHALTHHFPRTLECVQIRSTDGDVARLVESVTLRQESLCLQDLTFDTTHTHE